MDFGSLVDPRAFQSGQLAQQEQQIIIRGESCEIVVNKIRLMRMSLYFRRLYSSSAFNECHQKSVDLPVRMQFLNVFDDLLKGNIIKINEQNILVTIWGSSYYGISVLYLDMHLFIRSNINNENCMKYLYNANKYNFCDLKNEIFKYCCKHFRETPNNYYKKVHIYEFLSSRLLHADEGDLLKIVVAKEAGDQFDQTACLKLIRLDLVPTNVLVSLSLPPELHSMQVDIRQNLMDRRKFKAASKARCLEQKRYKQERAVILALNGSSNCRTMECWYYNDTEWRYSIPTRIIDNKPTSSIVLPHQNYSRHDTMVTFDDYNVYVIGGSYEGASLKTCSKFSIELNGWTAFPDLPEPVHGHSVAMCDDQIYVTGGVDSSGMFAIGPTFPKRNWITLQDLPEPRFDHSSVGAFGYVYIIGGYMSCLSDEPTATCWRYNVMGELWEKVPPLLTARANMSAVLNDAQIYVFGGRDEAGDLKCCEKFDIKLNRWLTVCDMSQAKSFTAAVRCENRIFLSGGEANGTATCTTDIYNPLTDVWHSTHSMQISRRAHSLAVLYIPEMELSDMEEIP